MIESINAIDEITTVDFLLSDIKLAPINPNDNIPPIMFIRRCIFADLNNGSPV